MTLVKHVGRGFGHALQLDNGNWQVNFFDDYDRPVVFYSCPNPDVLTFLDED
jgi:hypothetical protein